MAAALPARLREALDVYAAALQDGSLSAATRRVYRSRVAGYLAYLAGRAQPVLALRDPHARNQAVGAYQRHLSEQGRATSAVNAILVAVDHFYRHLGLGDAVVSRDLVVSAPAKPLSPAARRAVLAPAGTGATPVAVRDLAVVTTVFYTGLAGAGVAGLDVDDVDMDGAQLRAGDRVVPLPADLARLLRRWLRLRAQWPPAEQCSALFVNRFGGRLSGRSVTEVVQRASDRAGVELSSAVLRATFAAALAEAGAAPEVVAALTGRSRTAAGPVPDLGTLRGAMRRLTRRL